MTEKHSITLKPIGIIRTPFKKPKGTPIQPIRSGGAKGKVRVYPEFARGLADLHGFSHIILVYHFHLSKGYLLEARPFVDEEVRGVFAMRGPARPNPIGISAVRLVEVEDCTLYIEDVDIVDGTPLSDIKPYVPDFDGRKVERIGWLSEKSRNIGQQRADSRFQSA